MKLGLLRRGFLGIALAVGVALVAAALTWGCAPARFGAPGEAPVGSVGAPGDGELALEESLRFRRDFGLRRDLEYVKSLLDGSVPVASHTYGVPLTAAEDKELQQRSAISSKADLISRYAARRAQGSFGGAYIDQAHGGRVYVGFTKAPERHLAQLRRLYPYPGKLRLFSVRHTETELEQTQDKITDALPKLVAQGLNISTVGINVQDNVVEIGVDPIDPRTVATLTERFGDNKIRVINSGRFELAISR